MSLLLRAAAWGLALLLLGRGLLLALSGWASLRGRSLVKRTPWTPIDGVEAGRVVKLRGVPEAPFAAAPASGAACAYFETAFTDYVWSGGEAPAARPGETQRGPDVLLLRVGGALLAVDMRTRRPLLTARTLSYRQSPSGGYELGWPSRPAMGERYARESLLRPGEEVVVFGELEATVRREDGTLQLFFAEHANTGAAPLRRSSQRGSAAGRRRWAGSLLDAVRGVRPLYAVSGLGEEAILSEAGQLVAVQLFFAALCLAAAAGLLFL
ncbi:MAG: hypothetical protein WC943_11540 [Elusimicrobiota bacterium]|jgi:hypothetical protein